jgi:hypothetical protein
MVGEAMSDLEQIPRRETASVSYNRNMGPQPLRPVAVARILRCKLTFAHELILSLDHVLVGGEPRIARETLEAWVASRLVEPPVRTATNREPSVYFIASADLSRVKIGKTQGDLSSRSQSRYFDLQRSSPYQLLLVADVIGYTAVERWLHMHFRDHRLHGEWFLANPALDAMIAHVQAEGRWAMKTICFASLKLDLGRRMPAGPPPAPAYGPLRPRPAPLLRSRRRKAEGPPQ